MKKVFGFGLILIALVTLFVIFMFKTPTKKSNQDQPTFAPNAKTKITNNQAQEVAEFKAKLYNLINAYRKENGLSPLLVNPQLETSANLKLNDMMAHHTWNHLDNQNRPPWQFFKQAGYAYKKAGENLGFNQPSAFAVFDAWTKSPTHNQQLLNKDYEHMGLAVDCHSLKELDNQAGCLVVLHLGKL